MMMMMKMMKMLELPTIARSGMSLIAGAEFMALHGQGTGHCTTHTHLVEQEAKTQTDDLVENPEFLNSGMLVGEDPTLITCSRTTPHRYKQGGVNTHEHSRILDFRNARYMLHTRSIQTGNMYAQKQSQPRHVKCIPLGILNS